MVQSSYTHLRGIPERMTVRLHTGRKLVQLVTVDDAKRDSSIFKLTVLRPHRQRQFKFRRQVISLHSLCGSSGMNKRIEAYSTPRAALN